MSSTSELLAYLRGKLDEATTERTALDVSAGGPRARDRRAPSWQAAPALLAGGARPPPGPPRHPRAC